MRPDCSHLVRRLYLCANDVVETQTFLVEPGGDVLNIIDVPGDRMKMLTEAVVEFLHRLIAQVLYASRHHRFHNDLPDSDEGGVAPSQLLIAVVETGHRKDLIVPFVNRVEVVHD